MAQTRIRYAIELEPGTWLTEDPNGYDPATTQSEIPPAAGLWPTRALAEEDAEALAPALGYTSWVIRTVTTALD